MKGGAETGGFERAGECFAVEAGHRFIADDGGAMSTESDGGDEVSGAGECSGFDEDIIRALGEIDMDGGHGRSMKKAGRMSIPDDPCIAHSLRACLAL